MRTIKIISFFYVTCLFANPDPIGEVIASENVVWAINQEGVRRDLNRGSSIFLLDEMHVGDESRLQVRFTDGSILNLIEDTIYAIRGYRYRKMFEKDEYVASLVKGGFRSLTGAIAKKNPDGYEVKTPTATIGVRGTIIDALLTHQGLYVSCTKGTAIVMNDAGHFRIGPAESRQFLLIENTGMEPRYFIQRPSEMNLQTFAPLPDGASIDAARVPSPKTSTSSTPAPQESAALRSVHPVSGSHDIRPVAT